MSGRTRFTELHPLGAGGMGEVQLARMDGDAGGELVALKRIRSEQAQDPSYLEQFQREARLSAKARHPNVVGLRDFGTDERGPYLALEYVHGRSAAAVLRRLKQRGQALPLDAALALAADAGRALAYLHGGMLDVPVIHRDISPDNLLLGYDGRVRLSDLGVARAIGGTHLTQTGALRGKLRYFAPELFEAKPADARSDVFALGVTLFELVVGIAPFTGNSDADLMYAILNARPPRAQQLRPDLPVGLAQWIDGALARAPDARPEGAQLDAACASPGGAAALTALLHSLFPPGEDAALAQLERTVLEERAKTGTAARVPPRRRMGRVAALGIALLVVGGGAGAGLLAWGRPGQGVGGVQAGESASGAQANAPERGVQAEAAHGLQAQAAAPGPGAQGQGAAPTPSVQAGSSAADAPVRPAVAAPQRSSQASRGLAPSPKSGNRRTKGARGAAAKAMPPAVANASAEPGTLHIRAYPWARVFLDGADRGVTPLPPMSVSAGEHVVTLVNEQLGVREQRRVKVVAGEAQELKVLLEVAQGGAPKAR